jgi:8-oxo-dGTP diphosphatase
VPRVIEGRTFEACANDDFVLWHDPKVVTSVVVEVGERVLLGRRSIEPGKGLWCLPGGFVNDDEDPADAARRECREEIGAGVEITGLLGVYHIAKRSAPSMVGVAYRARLADGERPEPGTEMLELETFDAGALPELAFPSHREILERFFRSREQPAEPAHENGGAEVPTASPPSQRQARSPRRRRS